MSAMPAQSQELSDNDVARAIETELRYDDSITFNRIGVSVDDGIATLTGTVSSLAGYRQTENIVSTVRGVTGIVNRMVVDVPPVAPDELESRVSAAFERNSATDAYELTVTADDSGVVILEGVVDSWAERRLAETVASATIGVAEIDNRVDVDTSRVYRGVGEIEAEIAELLRWDARVDDSLIEVLVREGGRVTLSGTVGSLAEKQLAHDLAFVRGVQSVESEHLQVEGWARDINTRLGVRTSVSDGDIRQAIEKSLTLDPRIASSGIEISVIDGSVWLQGEVAHFGAWRAAEQDARNIVGARDVFNFLRVSPVMLDDQAVEADAVAALEASGVEGIDALQIDVRDGRARLSGDVDDAEQYWTIDDIVANTRGIEEFHNDLTIRGQLPRFADSSYMGMPRPVIPRARNSTDILSDRSLHVAVESELFWSPFIDENRVSISVEDGIVTLTGNVESPREYFAATDNAIQAGAISVQNELEIE